MEIYLSQICRRNAILSEEPDKINSAAGNLMLASGKTISNFGSAAIETAESRHQLWFEGVQFEIGKLAETYGNKAEIFIIKWVIMGQNYENYHSKERFESGV